MYPWFGELLAETDRPRKMKPYEQVAAAAFVPIGASRETRFAATRPEGEQYPESLDVARDYRTRLFTPEE